MRKKYVYWGLILAVFILFLITACSGGNTSSVQTNSQDKNETNQSKEPETNQQVIQMDLNNPTPSTNHFGYNVFEPWKELVEEKTDSRVKVNLYHGGTLGTISTAFEDISGGVYDVGILITTYYYDNDLFPWNIANLPFAFGNSPTPELSSKIISDFIPKYWNEDLLFKDTVYMGGTSVTDGYVMFSTNPIEKAEDLKGLKMRVPGKGADTFINNLGGVPVSFAVDEIYEAFERGLLDVAIHTPIGAYGHKYFEVAPYIVDNLPFSVAPVFPLMNRDFYESLPEDLKKLFDEELNPAMVDLINQSYTKEVKVTWEKLASEVGGKGEISQLPDEEIRKLQAAGADQWDAWVEDANKKGYPGDQMMEDFKAALRENGIKLPF